MTTENRLARGEVGSRIIAPSDPAERRRFWIERGNRILWGQEPMTGKKYAGQYLAPRTDLEWVYSNGSYSIQKRGA